MAEHIFRDGKTYLEFFDDGILYFNDQKIKKLVPDQPIEEFYDLIHFYVTNDFTDI